MRFFCKEALIKKVCGLLAACLLIAGCSSESGGGSGAGTSSTVSVTGITLNKSTNAIKVGEQFVLTATVTPSNATNKAVTWLSSDTSVATVSNGTVVAKKAGEATITAKSASNSAVSASCTVTVTDNAALTGVTISGSSQIAADATTKLTATPATTGSVTGVTYAWEITSGSDYATLSATTGTEVNITGKNTDTASGHDVTVKVTATWNGTTKSATHTINIAKKGETVVNSLESLTLEAGSSSASANDTISLTAKAGYYGDPSIAYTWSVTAGASYGTLATTTQSRAVLAYDTKTNTLTVANTTGSQQTITVKVTAVSGSTTKEASVNITAAALKATSVEITGTSSIAAAGDTILTATVNPANAPDTVNWEITSGSAYATLSATTGKTVTLTGTNTTSSSQTVKVKATAGTVSDTYDVTVAAKPAEYTEYAATPDVTSITVYNGVSGTTKKGTYSTVAAAIAACGSSGDYRIVLPKGTYSENGLVYDGSGTIRISGNSKSKWGSDVIIKGHGSKKPTSSDSAQNARELLLFKGTGNLILENLTLQTDWLRADYPGVSTMQAEVLGFNSSGKVAAYNCSFNSYQDTVRTVGKGWFYNCHVEGDVDFIWMEAGGKVALYEKCDIASVYDGSASAAYIAAPKIDLGNVCGKGVVIKDSAVSAASGIDTYLFRNPWNKNASAQYNQAAYVDCTLTGTFKSALSQSDANGTSDQQYVGWKVDSTIASAYTSKASKIGTLSSDTKTKEYSGRCAVLNRNYLIESARFEKDTAANWDIDSFITTVGWSVQTDSSADYYDGESVTLMYSWDLVSNNKPGAGYLASAQDSSVKLYLSADGGGDGCPCYHPASGSKVYIPASVGDKVEVTTHNGNYYGFKVGDVAATSNAFETTVTSTVSSGQSGDTNTYVLLSVTGSCYIHTITVTGSGSGSGSGSGEASGSGGEPDPTPSGDDWTWLASDYEAKAYSENTSCGNVTLIASSSAGLNIETNSKELDGVTYTSRVKTNGTGAKDKRALKFTLSGPATVTVYAYTGTANRPVVFANSEGVIASKALTTSLAAYEFSYTGTGEDVYLYSGDSGIYIVAFKVSYGSAASGSGTTTTPSVTSVTLSKSSVSLTAGGSETITATVNGTNLTDTSVTWSTSSSSVATVTNGKITAVAAGTATITATSKADSTKKATCSVTVTAAAGGDPAPSSGNVIKYTDKPVGFAGVGYTTPTFSKTVTVTTRAELMNAIKNEKTLIYVNGMIDMSDEGSGSKLPAKNTSNIAVSSVMDDWIASKSSNAYTSYQAWVTAYSNAVGKSTDDKKVGNTGNSELASTLWSLNDEWKKVIQLNLKSNTTIIGLGENSGLRGGTIAINGISNVVIRNLYLLDAIDMFPHHEKGDGYNSQFDCITIQGSGVKNIWIDHCTFEDTMVMQHVTNGLDSSNEKWQNYDGSCDIKGDAAGVTVSNCHFFKHDKTMLIGSDDSEGSNATRKVSLINNYFDSCVQRLPMVRNTQIHVLNNYYEFNKNYNVGDNKTKMSYGIGVRNGSLVYSQANYFGSNMNYPYDGDSKTKSTSKIYVQDDFSTKSGSGNYTTLSSAPFTPTYSYTPMTADDAKTYVLANAGHGTVTVEK